MADSKFRIDETFAPADLKAWEALIAKDLRGASVSSLRRKTEGGLPLEPLYTAENTRGEAGLPGLPPYTRGGEAARRGWTIRQEYADPRPEVIREQIAADLERGVEGLFIELGQARGVRLLSPADLGAALEGVALKAQDIWYSPGSDFFGVGAALFALARSKGVELSALSGSLGVDPLGSLAREGRLSAGLSGAYREARSLAAFAMKESQLRIMRVDTAPYAEAGATAVDELAIALSTLVTYLKKLVEWGEPIDAAAQRIDLAISTGGEFFEQIAKLRALRLLVAKVIFAAGGSADSQRLLIHARNGRFTKTQRDPWANLLRGTAESFAAALGGADSVATAPFDIALGESDVFSRRIARNTQLVLREEARVGDVVDPAGGSYFIERLTDEMARAAWEVFREIEGKGGLEAALKSGLIAAKLEEAAKARELAVRTRKRPILGVSEFPNLNEKLPEREASSAVAENAQEASGRAFGGDDKDARQLALMELSRAINERGDALLLRGIEALERGASLRELRGTLDGGEALLAIEPIKPRPIARLFEALRDKSDAYLKQTGARPKVFLALLGSVAEHTARATFAQNFLAAGGFETVEAMGLESSEGYEAYAEAFKSSGAKFIMIAGSDARYGEALPALTNALRAASPQKILLAGKALGDGDRDAEINQGIDEFVSLGADIYAILSGLYDAMGV